MTSLPPKNVNNVVHSWILQLENHLRFKKICIKSSIILCKNITIKHFWHSLTWKMMTTNLKNQGKGCLPSCKKILTKMWEKKTNDFLVQIERKASKIKKMLLEERLAFLTWKRNPIFMFFWVLTIIFLSGMKEKLVLRFWRGNADLFLNFCSLKSRENKVKII